jgi:hypothetical protein
VLYYRSRCISVPEVSRLPFLSTPYPTPVYSVLR